MLCFERIKRSKHNQPSDIFPETGGIDMNLNRHAKIIEAMQQQSPISVRQLALQLNCTEMTIRRNLDQLQEQGVVQRQHGYAVLLKNPSNRGYNIDIKVNLREKQAIAKAALNLLAPNMSFCLDSGTTTQQLAESIPDNLPLSVITPSLTASIALSRLPQVHVMMPAGYLHHKNKSLLIDDLHALEKYKVDLAFISCLSFQIPGGTFEHSQALTMTKRALASIAEKRVLLLDHTKWNVKSIFSCIPLEDVNTIITDSGTPQSLLSQASDAGIEVIVADVAAGASEKQV